VASRGGNPLRSMMDEGQTRRRSRFQFVADVYTELTKVTWPNRHDATRLSLLVILVAGAMGVFLGLWDLGLTEAVERFLLDEAAVN
jgi:preprotein translocase SecE subunit